MTDLTKIYSAKDNTEADLLKNFLEQEGIFVHIQGYNHRSLLGTIGSYIPLNLMVPNDEAERAKTLIENYLTKP